MLQHFGSKIDCLLARVRTIFLDELVRSAPDVNVFQLASPSFDSAPIVSTPISSLYQIEQQRGDLRVDLNFMQSIAKCEFKRLALLTLGDGLSTFLRPRQIPQPSVAGSGTALTDFPIQAPTILDWPGPKLSSVDQKSPFGSLGALSMTSATQIEPPGVGVEVQPKTAR